MQQTSRRAKLDVLARTFDKASALWHAWLRSFVANGESPAELSGSVRVEQTDLPAAAVVLQGLGRIVLARCLHWVDA